MKALTAVAGTAVLNKVVVEKLKVLVTNPDIPKSPLIIMPFSPTFKPPRTERLSQISTLSVMVMALVWMFPTFIAGVSTPLISKITKPLP